MTTCSHELRDAGQAYPRTCAVCGLGPCRNGPPPPRYKDADDLAEQIASKIFSHNIDRARRDELATLLHVFAAEIKRSAVEP